MLGMLLENTRALRKVSTPRRLTKSYGWSNCLNFIVSGAGGFAIARIRRSEVRLETASLFHSKLNSQYLYDAIIEAVITEALKIGKKLPDPPFNP
jgi:hypothetical protein